MTDSHYTVTVEVHKTTPEKRVYRDSYDKEGHIEKRVTEELSKVVIRDDDLATVLAEGVRHLELIELKAVADSGKALDDE